MAFGTFPPQVRRRVVVTGLGAVTPLGVGAQSTWSALCEGKSATRALREAPFFFPSSIDSDRRLTTEEKGKRREELLAAMPCQVAAPVIGELVSTTDLPNFAPTSRETRATRFALHAVREALIHAKLIGTDAFCALTSGAVAHPNEAASDNSKRSSAPERRIASSCSAERIGVNLGVGMPSLVDVCDAAYNLFADPAQIRYNSISPLFVPKILGNMLTGLVAMTYNVHGPVGSSVGACATGGHCIGESASWIQQGRADVVICGSAEACITPVAIAGFSRMRALCTKYNNRPQEASRPFDKDRAGFIMGEGAGVLVLESLEHARERGAHIIAELRGFGTSSDAHDVAAPRPDGYGAKLCLRSALRDGGDVPAACVAYVNAHATGTIGDDLELHAIEAVLNGNDGSDNKSAIIRNSPLLVSSVKGGIGHLLGAAGSVEAAVAVMALHEQRAPPNVNLHVPSFPASGAIQLVQGTTGCAFKGEAVVSTSFGFGGMSTALLFTQF
ncbi:beta-ketoacyl synthase family protein, putative [Trypanosoma brucei gambiense DAL972]|uniref:beta-ketoacyl-[acyl-carrier-protein] synthase I n=1 Tax=Trypanosoma brucei gambiense (strain MHOM/CI/86/DAL972) TaxID=679716 RepID=C9ZJB4_TRYB9|nr:beta-ketoacyl synthase family protein, putative [Trypanosoma brucei gambiense DAL972]CBH09473.1 beta-ketoacyl synthase family protein, putative [Trypanosoma brucei gambiense DAL972]|eukprot:XP_011771778.1 beta-ketoacyl synthase family protein, putative [Trypanosoma brucei gambiense DAL972]